MSDLQAAFEQAIADSRQLPDKPASSTLLKLYGLYKQAMEGNAEASRPGFADMVGRAKHDAWSAESGRPKEEAMRDYIDLIESLK
jgi:acyl-CoA-binding protein